VNEPAEMPLADRVHRGPPALHYVEGPAVGPTLLLLHGVTRCWRDWASLLPELAQEWQVVALDHCGHGESGRTPGAYRVIDYARRVEAFVRESEFRGPLVVFGHSLGAMVALHLAAECPEKIVGAVLEDPPFHTMGENIGATAYRPQFAGMQEVARRGGEVEAMTDALADIRVPGPNGEVRLGDTRDRASLRFSAECLVHIDPEVFAPLVAGTWLDGFDHLALWPRVKCPLLLLQGDPRNGGALTDEDADLAERTAARCQRVRFEGVGHQIHRTVPQQVVATVCKWAHEAELLHR
jgi:pimeloyl-ACP methyl ester carboxylesterase